MFYSDLNLRCTLIMLTLTYPVCHSPPFTIAHLVPWTGPTLISVLHFFKCVFIVPRSFATVFHTRLYFTLIRLTPLLLSHFLSHLSPVFLVFLSPFFKQLSVISLQHFHIHIQCILTLFITILFFSSTSPQFLSNSATITSMFSLFLYIYDI
jgi:hypothetical protein